MYGKGWDRVNLCGRKPESCAMRGLEGIYGRKPESGVCRLEYSYGRESKSRIFRIERKKDQDMLDSDSDSSDSESDVRRSEMRLFQLVQAANDGNEDVAQLLQEMGLTRS